MLGGPGAGSVLCSTARPRVSLLTRVPPWLGGVPGGGVGVPRGCKAALFILIFFLPIFSIRGFVPASLFTGRSISTANLPCLQATRCASSHRAGADTSSPYRSIGLGGGGLNVNLEAEEPYLRVNVNPPGPRLTAPSAAETCCTTLSEEVPVAPRGAGMDGMWPDWHTAVGCTVVSVPPSVSTAMEGPPRWTRADWGST